MSETWNEPFEAWAKLSIPDDENPLSLDARLKFDPFKGVVLDFVSPRELAHRLTDLEAGITGIGTVYLPEATFKAQSIGLNHEYRFTARSVVILRDGLDHVLDEVVRACSDFPEGEAFLGHDPFKPDWSGDDEYTIKAKNVDLDVPWNVAGTSLNFETAFQTKWTASEHYRLRPLTSFTIEHEEPATWRVRLEELNRLRAMLDFLSYEAHPWSISHLRDALDNRMTHIAQLSGNDAPSSPKASSFFALSLKDIQSDLGALLRFGFSEAWSSSSFGEILGLIRFPNRTFDERLFSAIRSLETRDRELRPNTTDKLIPRLAAFDWEWNHLGIPDIGTYKWLLRNTRNHLAHLSTDEGEPPFNENDRYRAFFQCVAACRSSILRAGGMSDSAVQPYLTRVADKCRAFHGPMDFSTYPQTPDWVRRVVV